MGKGDRERGGGRWEEKEGERERGGMGLRGCSEIEDRAGSQSG